MANPLDIYPEDLPETLALFPLSGALLLPHCHLPLNVFEPRYLRMTLDALANRRLIGMIQPREANDKTKPRPLYRTGCAGKIVFLEETEDQNLIITLKGVCRFRIKDELPEQDGYRRITPDWTPYLEDFRPERNSPVPRQALLDHVMRFAQHSKTHRMTTINIQAENLETIPTPLLINILSMTLPLEPRDKQALLEAKDSAHRAELLTGLINMDMLASAEEPSFRQ